MRFLQAMQRIYIVVLWIAYFNKHPEVVQYAEQFDDFADNYKNADDREISNVDVIQAYIKGDRGSLGKRCKDRPLVYKSLMQ